MMVQRYMALAFAKPQMRSASDLPAIPHPALRIDAQQQTAARSRLGLQSPAPVLGLCPGAEFGPAKRWPEAHYANIAERWCAQGGQVWIFGSGKDRQVATSILNHLSPTAQGQCQLLTGETSLTEARRSARRLCRRGLQRLRTDAHHGGGRKPHWSPSGSTSTIYTPPLSEQVKTVHTDIDCRPCFKRECPLGHLNCLKQLDPDRVWQALQQLLA